MITQVKQKIMHMQAVCVCVCGCTVDSLEFTSNRHFLVIHDVCIIETKTLAHTCRAHYVLTLRVLSQMMRQISEAPSWHKHNDYFPCQQNTVVDSTLSAFILQLILNC